MVTLLLGLMFTFLFLGFPLMFSMIIAPLVVLIKEFPIIQPMLITQQTIAGVSPYTLLAVPMFIFAADIMSTGETADRLLDMVDKFVGHMSGGLAITTGATCTLFGAISGSTQATLVAVGKTMHKKMSEAGYDISHTLALLMSSANIALLIPPSITMIMYAVITGTSVGELFIAGIGPGIIVFLLFAAFDYAYAKFKNIPTTPKATWSERLESIKSAIWPLGFPVIVLGGFYTGIFSPTEAAACSVLYAALIELFVFKSIKFKDLPDIALSTGVVTATVFILVAGGQAFSWVITFAKIPQMLTSGVLGADPSATFVLFTISIFFFISCMFVDSIPVILILTPIFYPVAMKAGVDPIHLGLIATMQAGIGAITPPFGCNIFTASAVFDEDFITVVKGVWPYMLLFVFASIMMVLFPSLALFFRDLVYF